MTDAAPRPVQAAIDELRAMRSTDPCAAIAMTTIKAAVHTLERYWIVDEPPEPGDHAVV